MSSTAEEHSNTVDDRNNNDELIENISSSDDFWETVAGVAGNILEWYDFAVFGYFSDVIANVFFPKQDGDLGLAESFAVFGGAFIMRPVGGVFMGYIGDTFGRKKALVISIFLMAFPTFAMGCLPTYDMVGAWAILFLVIIRLLQGLSVGGQLVSSLVFTLERHKRSQWGWYGSFVLAAANFGTLLGGIVGYVLKTSLNDEQLESWGWRLPFWMGLLVSISGIYLRRYGHETHTLDDETGTPHGYSNPLKHAFSKGNRRALLAASMVPMMWSGGFYFSFVWLVIYMSDQLDPPIRQAFAINSIALLLSVCSFFPIAGLLSDRWGRKKVMTCGGIGMAILTPCVITIVARVGNDHPGLVFLGQASLGISVSLWGAPMCAWLVESFPPRVRLTSVAIGYNVAQAAIAGPTPALATLLADTKTTAAPGFWITIVAVLSLMGLWCVAPPIDVDAAFASSLSPRTADSSSNAHAPVPQQDHATPDGVMKQEPGTVELKQMTPMATTDVPEIT